MWLQRYHLEGHELICCFHIPEVHDLFSSMQIITPPVSSGGNRLLHSFIMQMQEILFLCRRRRPPPHFKRLNIHDLHHYFALHIEDIQE